MQRRLVAAALRGGDELGNPVAQADRRRVRRLQQVAGGLDVAELPLAQAEDAVVADAECD